jgi:hypothetical protein
MLSQVEYEYLFYRTSDFHVKLKNTVDRSFDAMIFSPENFRNGTLGCDPATPFLRPPSILQGHILHSGGRRM